MRKRLFTKSEQKKILKEYLKVPVKRLARQLNTSFGVLASFLKEKNLHIPQSLRNERKRMFRFQKGHIPFNKGVPLEDFMSPEGIEVNKKNRFKKGHNAVNTKEIGTVVIKTLKKRKYKYMKVGTTKWAYVHIVEWQKHNGTIPKDHLIVFKDGCSLNTDVKNLEKITRIELAFRNNKTPVEIIPSMILINKINTKIQNLQNEK